MTLRTLLTCTLLGTLGASLSGCTAFRPDTRYAAQADHFLRDGAYDDAVERSLRALESNPENQQARDILRRAYPSYATETRTAIDGRGADPNDLEATQRDLSFWNDTNGRLEALGSPVEIVDISAELDARTQLSYDQAVALAGSENRDDLIAAARLFRSLGEYKDAQTLYQDARERATYRVAVFVTAEPSITDQYGRFYEGLADDAIQALERRRSLADAGAFEFLRFTPTSVEPDSGDTDSIVTLFITEVALPDPSSSTEPSRTFEKRVEVGRREGPDGNIEIIYSTFNALARYHSRQTTTTVSGVARVTSADGDMDESPVGADGIIRQEWVTDIRGQRRAIDEELLVVPDGLPSRAARAASARDRLERALTETLEPFALRELD